MTTSEIAARPADAPPPPGRFPRRHRARGEVQLTPHDRIGRDVLRCLGPGPPLDADLVARLDRLCTRTAVAAGDVVLRAGQPVDSLLVVTSGELALAWRGDSGGRRIISLVHPREVIGDVSLLSGAPLRAQAVALTSATLVAVDRQGLVALLAASPELALRWLAALSRRLLAYQDRVLTLLHKDLARQVATVLLLEQERTPAGDRVVHLAHATIAQLLGASRQSVTRVVHDLRRWGLVEPGYRRLDLVDPGGLAHVAQGRRPSRKGRR